MTGFFIVLEGGDGVGKTTQAELLEEWVTSELKRTVLRTREPGATMLGQEIREILLHADFEISARAEALLYAADRAQHIAQVVKPALARGEVVIQDRYIFSSLAYQGAGRTLDLEKVREISAWASEDLWPDVTLVFDLPTAEAKSRQQKRNEKLDRLESEAGSFHEAVRQGFLRLAKENPKNTFVVDARRSSEQIFARVQEIVAPLLASQNAL